MAEKPSAKPPNPILIEKQTMFAEQASRVSRAKPLNAKQQAAFARALVARLEQNATPTGPARITMASAGPMPSASAYEPEPQPREPERIGGCFADLLDDAPTRNEGAHEKETAEEVAEELSEEDEEPFG